MRETGDVLALQGELAEALADAVSANVVPGQKPHQMPATSVGTEAEDLYFQGMQHSNALDENSALSYFQQAVQIAPNFAQAHAALASCYGRLGRTVSSTTAKPFPNSERKLLQPSSWILLYPRVMPNWRTPQ